MAHSRDASWEDFDAVFDLLDARSRAAFGISEQKPEYLRQRWELPAHQRWVSVEGDRITGYASLDEDQEFELAAREPAVGDALLALVEHHARAHGFDQISATAVPEDEPLYALLQRSAFTLDREILRRWRSLDGELPEPAWPAGVNLRTYDDADGLAVHALLDEAYADWDRDHVARSHEGWLAFMTAHGGFDPDVWFLVERDDDLIACALHWKESQGRGGVKDIVVRESERGNGLGKALLQHAFRTYAARGVERVGLKVDSTNPTGAPQLYERLGFVTDQRLGIWQKRL